MSAKPAAGVLRRVLVDPLDDAWALYDLAAEKWSADAPAPQPCRSCSVVYRARRVRCGVCGYWKASDG